MFVYLLVISTRISYIFQIDSLSINFFAQHNSWIIILLIKYKKKKFLSINEK